MPLWFGLIFCLVILQFSFITRSHVNCVTDKQHWSISAFSSKQDANSFDLEWKFSAPLSADDWILCAFVYHCAKDNKVHIARANEGFQSEKNGETAVNAESLLLYMFGVDFIFHSVYCNIHHSF